MSSKNKQQKKGGAVLDDGLDSFLEKIQPQKFSNDQAVTYFVLGFFISLVPAYLYSTVFDLSLSEYGLLYLVVSLGSAAMLTLAYRNVEQTTVSHLSSSRKTGYYPSAKNAEESSALLSQEALSWSLFFNNAIFVACFLFLAFYALRSVETLYSYALSSVVSAAVAWQLSAKH